MTGDQVVLPDYDQIIGVEFGRLHPGDRRVDRFRTHRLSDYCILQASTPPRFASCNATIPGIWVLRPAYADGLPSSSIWHGISTRNGVLALWRSGPPSLSAVDRPKSTVVDYDTLIARGRAQIEAGQLEEAERTARRAIEADQDRPDAYNLLGGVHQLRLENAEALRFYHVALEMDHGYEPAHRNVDNLARSPTERKQGQVDLGTGS